MGLVRDVLGQEWRYCEYGTSQERDKEGSPDLPKSKMEEA